MATGDEKTSVKLQALTLELSDATLPLEEESHRLVFEIVGQAIDRAERHSKSYQEKFDKWGKLLEGQHFRGAADEDPEPQRLVLNEIGNQIRYFAAFLTDRVPSLRCYPASDGTTEEMSQLMRTQLVSLWKIRNWRQVVSYAIRDMLTYGVGFLEGYWDPYAFGGAGTTHLRRHYPGNILVPPGSLSLSDAPYFVVRRWVDPANLELATSGVAVGEQADIRELQGQMPGSAPIGGMYPVPTQDVRVGRPIQASAESSRGDLTELHDIWVRVIDEAFRVGWYRFTVNKEKEEILVLPEFFAHLPWGHMVFMSLEGREFYGQGLAEMTYAAQRGVNEIMSMVNRQIHLTADPPWVQEASAFAGRNRPKKLRPGGVMTVNDGMFDRVGFRNPPQLQREQFTVVEMLMQYFGKVSGITDLLKGPTQPTTGYPVGTVERHMEGATVLLREQAANYERATEQLLTGVASIMAKMQLTGRRWPVTDGDVVSSYIDIPDAAYIVNEGTTTQGIAEFAVHFDAGSSMAVSLGQRALMALQFHQALAPQGGAPPEWLAKQLGVEGAAELLELQRQAEEQRTAQEQAAIVEAAKAISQATDAIRGGTTDAQGQRGRPDEGVVDFEGGNFLPLGEEDFQSREFV